MAKEPLLYATSPYQRNVLRAPTIAFKNRFVEASPILNERQVSATSRPALKKLAEVGTGPVRGVFSSPSLFGDDLFVVSGLFLHYLTPALIQSSVGQLGTSPIGGVSWAAVANIGSTPARLFIAEGGILWVYTRDGEAQGRLEVSLLFVDTNQVRIGAVYYQFTAGSVDAGTPAGTSTNPWLVRVSGLSTGAQLQDLFDAINDSGEPGVQYSTALEEHPEVRGTALTATDLIVTAKEFGSDGNSIVTTETSANAAWQSGTLTGGGEEQLRQVLVPNDAGAISIAHINSYVIVVPEQSEDLGTLGEFYWIEPGDTFIDPINFANAERTPDEIHQVGEFGNLFWLFGAATTEPWLTTGNPDAPMQRYDSILFDRGSWPGTAVQVKDSLVVVDQNGGVFKIQGGQERLSSPDIEERIRKAIQRQQQLTT